MTFVPPAGFDELNLYMTTGDYTLASEQTRQRVLLEMIYCVLNNGGGGGTNMAQIVAVTSGGTYTNAALIGKTIFNVFYDGRRLNSDTTPGYTFDDTTGTITFTFTPDDGIELAIDYVNA